MNKGPKLQRISKHVWILPFNSPKDRPNLGYILGGEKALAVDAGHSSNAIRSENLPLPELTVITHWHWDHTFGMHAVHGEILARPETSDKLAQIQAEMEADPDKASRFLNSDASIRREYAGGVPLKVVPAGKIVTEDQSIDLGGLTVELLWSVSPHTDDSLLVYVGHWKPYTKEQFLAEIG